MSRLVSFAVLIGILVIIVVLFYQVMAVFLLPLFLAALLGVIFQPLYRWSLGKLWNNRYAAAGLTTVLVLLSVLLPAGLVITMATLQGISVVEKVQATDVRGQLTKLRKNLHLEIPAKNELQAFDAKLKKWRDELRSGELKPIKASEVDILIERLYKLDVTAKEDKNQNGNPPSKDELEAALLQLRSAKIETYEQEEAVRLVDLEYRNYRRAYLGGSFLAWVKELANPTDEQIELAIQRATSSAGSPLLSLGGDTLVIVGKLLLGIIITVASLFFFFAEGSTMIDGIVRLSPLEEKYVRELVEEFERVCRAVVTATLLSAVVQGILAGIGFYFAGLTDSVALLMLLTMVFAMVPFTGAATVWVPVCLYLYFVEDRLVAALLLAVYGAGVVSLADNFIKPLVLHGQSNLHPLLALLSILGGIQALGPIGIIVGPMVVVFLQTTLKILQRELTSMDRLSAAAAIGLSGPPTVPLPQEASASAPPSPAITLPSAIPPPKDGKAKDKSQPPPPLPPASPRPETPPPKTPSPPKGDGRNDKN